MNTAISTSLLNYTACVVRLHPMMDGIWSRNLSHSGFIFSITVELVFPCSMCCSG
jgi:hypothetical protein